MSAGEFLLNILKQENKLMPQGSQALEDRKQNVTLKINYLLTTLTLLTKFTCITDYTKSPLCLISTLCSILILQKNSTIHNYQLP